MTRKPPTLKARAIRLLARREYSRAELRRKLTLAIEGEAVAPEPARLESLLDELEVKGLLSDRRFAEVVVRGSGTRYGAARIARTLGEKGVAADLAAPLLDRLKAHEPQVAFELWSRRFDSLPSTPQEKARQFRFLLQRGFGPQTVHKVWKIAHERLGSDDASARLSIDDLMSDGD